jgi:hypothetical protein
VPGVATVASVVAFDDPVVVISPLRAGIVVTCPAVSPAAVPVAFVRTTEFGVPRFGAVNVGPIARTIEPDPVEVSSDQTPELSKGKPEELDQFWFVPPFADPTNPVTLVALVALVAVEAFPVSAPIKFVAVTELEKTAVWFARSSRVFAPPDISQRLCVAE